MSKRKWSKVKLHTWTIVYYFILCMLQCRYQRVRTKSNKLLRSCFFFDSLKTRILNKKQNWMFVLVSIYTNFSESIEAIELLKQSFERHSVYFPDKSFFDMFGCAAHSASIQLTHIYAARPLYIYFPIINCCWVKCNILVIEDNFFGCAKLFRQFEL